MNKKEMRRYLRALFPGDAQRNAQSDAICRHILASPEYGSARVIGGYMSMRHEADVLPVLRDALASGKMLALPLCGQAPFMTFRAVYSLDDLLPGAYGIPEPSPDAPLVAPEDIDLLLVPLEGIDFRGYRLGKGGGYYDRLLSEADGFSLGCALSWQITDEIPRDPWDKPLSACAGPAGIERMNDTLKGPIYDGQEQKNQTCGEALSDR